MLHFRYVAALKEHSSYSASEFVNQVVKAFPFKIECVQTDNGQEFTKRLGNFKNPKPTQFQNTLLKFGINHNMIRPYTPRHNGKVEDSHRKDNEHFYAVAKFYSFNDFKLQLKKHNARYNNFPMRRRTVMLDLNVEIKKYANKGLIKEGVGSSRYRG